MANVNALANSLQIDLMTAKNIDVELGTQFSVTISNLIADLQKYGTASNDAPLWINGMSKPDDRGFVQLQAAEEIRALALNSTNIAVQLWAKGGGTLPTGGTITGLSKWWAINDVLNNPNFTLTQQQNFNVWANTNNAQFQANVSAIGLPQNDPARMSWFAYQMTAPTKGGLYDVGPRQMDATAFSATVTVPQVRGILLQFMEKFAVLGNGVPSGVSISPSPIR